MLNINRLIADESGAVTVDWVVLTAALVGLGLAVMSVVSGSIGELPTNVSSDLTDMDPKTADTFFGNAATGGDTGGSETAAVE